MMNFKSLSVVETSTIKTALRLYEQSGLNANASDTVRDMATDYGSHDPITQEQFETLFAKILLNGLYTSYDPAADIVAQVQYAKSRVADEFHVFMSGSHSLDDKYFEKLKKYGALLALPDVAESLVVLMTANFWHGERDTYWEQYED